MQQSRFNFFGNNMAVDFVNTSFIHRGKLVDLLGEIQDFYDWFDAVGIEINLEQTDDALTEILDFRSLLREGFEHRIADKPVNKTLLHAINRYLPHYHVMHEVTEREGQFCLSTDNTPNTLSAALAIIGYEAALLLCSDKACHLKGCANENCAAMFVDTSKAKKRRWCSMEICGNRSKAANHYAQSKKSA